MTNSQKTNSGELEFALKHLNDGECIVLATVIETWGSSPRPVGSYMVVNSSANFMGSVSGGCVEGEVVTQALDVLEEAIPRTLEFSVSTADAWEVGLSCGGNIRILLQRLSHPQQIQAVIQLASNSQTFALFTDVKTGNMAIAFDNKVHDHDFSIETDVLLETTATIRNKGTSQLVNIQGETFFIRCFKPNIQLIIIGAVHISQILAPLASLMGYLITVIDPRELFAQDSRFKEHPVCHCWPDEYFEDNSIDSNTAIITLTHDPKIDDIALEFALASNAFYIGSLGSKKTHSQRVDRLKEQGFSLDQIDRIHAPVGLSLGGRSPSEIALAILAQVVETRYK